MNSVVDYNLEQYKLSLRDDFDVRKLIDEANSKIKNKNFVLKDINVQKLADFAAELT